MTNKTFTLGSHLIPGSLENNRFVLTLKDGAFDSLSGILDSALNEYSQELRNEIPTSHARAIQQGNSFVIDANGISAADWENHLARIDAKLQKAYANSPLGRETAQATGAGTSGGNTTGGETARKTETVGTS